MLISHMYAFTMKRMEDQNIIMKKKMNLTNHLSSTTNRKHHSLAWPLS